MIERAWRVADRAAHGLALDLGLYTLSGTFAALTAATSTLAPHRAWGTIAFWGYAAATLATVVAFRTGTSTRIRATVTGLTWAATALLPLVLQAVTRAGGRTDRAQEEVVVIEHSGQRLLEHGTPYLGREAIAALPEVDWLLGYAPYQPGMALFGLPRALAGEVWWTDARVWFAVVTAAALGAALRMLWTGGAELGSPGFGGAEPGSLVRAAQAVTVLPLAALTLATGGDDLPVLALCLLALALGARDRPGLAGLAVGAAAALKLFAWPVALVLAVTVLARGRARLVPAAGGLAPLGWPALGRPALARTALGRYAAGALGLPLLALLPAVLVDLAAAIENVLRFPLGHGLVTSPAQSPLPGHLIATGLPGGRVVAAALLVAAGLAIAGWLGRRPPRTAAAAAMICAYGLLAAVLLLPSTRFGYLLYPIAFAVWVPALRGRAYT